MTNLSFYAIPVYYSLTMIPHAYATLMMKKANNGRWNNASPNSTAWVESLRKSTPADVFSRYERAKACHRNGMENFPLFVGAVLAGNLAKLDTNVFVVGYLLSRVAYTLAYINISNPKISYIRSIFWNVGALWCMWIFVKSGLAMTEK
ncbi:uncharacterized protein PAC_08313 [Phialocephala subalpina]|uniref:Uncharacterized protein n=1 Tax=Phialocephala subalpina TaxID=576137 RepID=A0A1L7X082_9HELO|nr:uncharacterized protein PAC_08313 [Phialocephala subalpina]